jgi:hypothetical protein
MLRAEDVKRCTPVSCSLVSLALSADTTSQNLTSSGNDEWMGAVDLHLNLGDQHVKWTACTNTFLSTVDLACLVQLSCGWIFPEVFEVNDLPESVWRIDTNSRNFNLITKFE